MEDTKFSRFDGVVADLESIRAEARAAGLITVEDYEAPVERGELG
jgi:hypothetical protein